jgi:hypothetical protein
MSYYILPKINNKIIINPIDSVTNTLEPYISNSLFYYYNNIDNQIKKLSQDNYDLSLNYNSLVKIINPYEYIFSKVPGSNFSVSKLKTKSNLFYDFLEVSSALNIFEQYKTINIKTLHITHNKNDTIECYELLRENYSDEIMYYDNINDEIIKSIGDNKFKFLFFEVIQDDKYIISLLEYFMVILKNQEVGGTCILKISEIFYKPVVDVLYILSSLYDKVYILKPNTSNITSFDKYVICKNFQTNNKDNNLKFNYYKLLVFLKKLDNKNIMSILDFDIPSYFTIKLDDINITVGQQQLESLDSLISILKTKNKEEKIETIKKCNIQKSVIWCEKHKIPCNKFSDKINIFLPINKDEKI